MFHRILFVARNRGNNFTVDPFLTRLRSLQATRQENNASSDPRTETAEAILHNTGCKSISRRGFAGVGGTGTPHQPVALSCLYRAHGSKKIRKLNIWSQAFLEFTPSYLYYQISDRVRESMHYSANWSDYVRAL